MPLKGCGAVAKSEHITLIVTEVAADILTYTLTSLTKSVGPTADNGTNAGCCEHKRFMRKADITEPHSRFFDFVCKLSAETTSRSGLYF
ncbi:hypothetical protein Syun_030114 [Stephania yunnanensis]|uniref:Uncharacterized protein n=1 Tax=Stephania yunnanensis TaxID=152371 RepID=A0AAP0HM09_9MAGN